jgi:hypothetical protein
MCLAVDAGVGHPSMVLLLVQIFFEDAETGMRVEPPGSAGEVQDSNY